VVTCGLLYAANTGNPYCEVLGIQAPRLDVVRSHPAANTYALLIVALLERGAPMMLEDAARRFVINKDEVQLARFAAPDRETIRM
jgi:hypothetical protein